MVCRSNEFRSLRFGGDRRKKAQFICPASKRQIGCHKKGFRSLLLIRPFNTRRLNSSEEDKGLIEPNAPWQLEQQVTRSKCRHRCSPCAAPYQPCSGCNLRENGICWIHMTHNRCIICACGEDETITRWHESEAVHLGIKAKGTRCWGNYTCLKWPTNINALNSERRQIA